MSELDASSDAYRSEFPYHQENLGILAVYAGLLEAAIRSRGARRVLSLGIGHAAIISAMVRLMPDPVERYLVLEGSAKLAEKQRAKSQGPHSPEILEGYFEDFGRLETFDVIEMGFVLEHVLDAQLVLRHMTKFLAPRGVVVIAVPNARSLHRLIGFEAGYLNDLTALSEHDRQLGHRRYFDRCSLEALVADAGLNVETVRGLMLKPLTTSQLAAANLDQPVMEALYRGALNLPDIANAIYLEAVP